MDHYYQVILKYSYLSLLNQNQSMYGKIPERKLKQTDYLLSCEEARKELEEYMDTENRRVNVDSAKKLAVLQHMDYEGFRQMVLGANIFPAKSKEINSFNISPEEKQTAQNKLYNEKKIEQIPSPQAIVSGSSEKHCFNFRDFKKKFAKHYQKELTWERAEECYGLIKEQNKERLEKIFNLECEADILLKIIDVFQFIVAFLRKQQKEETERMECRFMVTFLQTVLAIPTMQDISLNILTKKQKERIILFLQDVKTTLNQEDEQASITKVCLLIKK